MPPLLQMIFGIAFCLFWGWLIFSKSHPATLRVTSQDDVIDPNNSYQIGYLLGMTGGTVTDATIARYAIERFEQSHGYKPTLRDAAILVGLMNGGNAMSWDQDSR